MAANPRFPGASAPGSSDELDPPVTVIREMQVKPGAEARFEALMHTVIEEACRRPGHLGATVVRPAQPGQPYRFIYKFSHRSRLDAWHQSEARAQLVAPIAELITVEKRDDFPGLETWFEAGFGTAFAAGEGGAPSRWKTTLLSWIAIYLLVLGVSQLLDAIGVRTSMAVQTLIVTAIVVPLVAYIVGP